MDAKRVARCLEAPRPLGAREPGGAAPPRRALRSLVAGSAGLYAALAAEWRAGAEEHPGSWWNHWASWLKERSGEQIPARDPAKGPLKPIEPAPGAYVKVKS